MYKLHRILKFYKELKSISRPAKITTMDMKKVKNFLERVNLDLFKFSYALIPDDLQAQQIVIDSVYVLTSENRDLVESMLDIEEEKKVSNEKKILVELYKYAYKIGLKRVAQLGRSEIKDFNSDNYFYKLPVQKRAVLFLRHRTRMSKDDISFIISSNPKNVYSLLMSARREILGKELDITS